MSLPQAAVALVGHSKDVRRQLPHLVLAVHFDCSAVVHAWDLLVGIHCCQDRTNVGLSAGRRQEVRRDRNKRGEDN